MDKTPGQVLYEYKNPSHIQVCRVEDTFRQNPFWVSVPDAPVPWGLLTEKCKQEWEEYAVGHHIFSVTTSTL